MQGNDYDTDLVKMHEHVWHNWTKFIACILGSVAVLLILMAAFLIN